jgi:hypothetical protein
MGAILRFLREHELWAYIILGALALLEIRKFALGWGELRGAAFGLERANAQARINGAASLLVLYLMLGVGVFMLVSFVIPLVPEAAPLPTPTLNLLATPTITLAAPGGQATPAATPLPTFMGTPGGEGCVPGQIAFIFPTDGAVVSGKFEVKGSANIPNFGFYKYEVARPGDAIWMTLQAGNTPVTDGRLGEWDTSTLPPDEYLLRLVVADNQNVAMPACQVRVRVVAPTPTP